jgi:hypothetical protein
MTSHNPCHAPTRLLELQLHAHAAFVTAHCPLSLGTLRFCLPEPQLPSTDFIAEAVSYLCSVSPLHVIRKHRTCAVTYHMEG